MLMLWGADSAVVPSLCPGLFDRCYSCCQLSLLLLLLLQLQRLSQLIGFALLLRRRLL